MGYTHYWQPTIYNDAEWAGFTEDVRAICKTAANHGINIVGPAGEAGTEPIINESTILLNGADAQGYETFHVAKNGNGDGFCKTGQRSYDVVITAILVVMYSLYQADVSSDGELGESGDNAFEAGLKMAQEALPEKADKLFLPISEND